MIGCRPFIDSLCVPSWSHDRRMRDETNQTTRFREKNKRKYVEENNRVDVNMKIEKLHEKREEGGLCHVASPEKVLRVTTREYYGYDRLTL